MKRKIVIKNINFKLGNYTARRNEYENKQKYKLFVDGVPSSYTFDTLKNGFKWIKENYFIFM